MPVKLSEISRRSLWTAGLSVSAAWLARGAHAAAPSFEVRELTVQGKRASRASLLVPTHLDKGKKVGLLVALHGLGESGDPALGVRAWLDLYGLRTSYERLLAPPVVPVGKRRDWTAARLAEVNRSLVRRPFAGLAVLCPFTPNVRKMADSAAAQKDYAEWLVDALIPAARKLAPVETSAAATTIDGCSMGGPIALETVLAHPTTFGAVGVVQPALSAGRAKQWAEGLAKARKENDKLAIHLLTSEQDPFVGATRALAKALDDVKVPHTLRVSPGPHDQPWLRETGTIEMLLFHERGRHEPPPRSEVPPSG